MFAIETRKRKAGKKNNDNLKIVGATLGVLLLIIIVSVILGSGNKDKTYTLSINGDPSIVIYKGSNYVDPGAKAYDENNADLSHQVHVNSNLDTNKIGRYEIIYTLNGMQVKRTVQVIDKQSSSNLGTEQESGKESIVTNGETKLSLKGNETVYLQINGKYKEQGYTAIDNKDGNITKEVKVTHNINNQTPGNYQIVYTVKNSSGIVTSAERKVVVLKMNMSLSTANSNYTNASVGININVEDEYFDYLVLPNGQSVSSKNYTYIVSDNGEYKFVAHNKQGFKQEKTITVNNIDKKAPTVSCSADFKNNLTTINISATDNIGVNLYVVNGKYYDQNIVKQKSFISKNNVVVYDKAGNSASTTCEVTPMVYIESIKKDGVIITVNARKVGREIAGYYFSYDSNRPSKETGGYVATSNDSIDVVRLPGTTYVWVEDTNGNISNYSTITIGNEAILITKGNDYATLQNQSLESFLSKSGWSKAELDKLIARSVRAAGVYSKRAAATAGIALEIVLAQKYKIKLPYWWGGKSWSFGASSSWGSSRPKYANNKWYNYDGLDCTGFVTWAYVNAGYQIKSGTYPSYRGGKSVKRENGEIGDIIVSPSHVKMIVGYTDSGFICAEASYGMNTSIHNYSKTSNQTIMDGNVLAQRYTKYPLSSIPAGY